MNIDPSSAKEAFVVFDPSIKEELSDVHFLKLKLFDAQGKLLSENFYWTGNTYLDYTSLQKLPRIGDQLKTSKPTTSKPSDGYRTKLTYTITNISSKGPAFGIRAQLLDNKGNQVLPAIFDDGYFTLMPNEKKVLHVEVNAKLLRNGYRLSVKPFNN